MFRFGLFFFFSSWRLPKTVTREKCLNFFSPSFFDHGAIGFQDSGDIGAGSRSLSSPRLPHSFFPATDRFNGISIIERAFFFLFLRISPTFPAESFPVNSVYFFPSTPLRRSQHTFSSLDFEDRRGSVHNASFADFLILYAAFFSTCPPFPFSSDNPTAFFPVLNGKPPSSLPPPPLSRSL